MQKLTWQWKIGKQLHINRDTDNLVAKNEWQASEWFLPLFKICVKLKNYIMFFIVLT
jgi:hypothetical protein